MIIIRKKVNKAKKVAEIKKSLFSEYYNLLKNTRTNLLNKNDFSFAIHVNKLNIKKLTRVVSLIENNGLTVYGDGTNKLRIKDLSRTMLGGVGLGETLVFGKNNRYDVELSTVSRSLKTDIGDTHPTYSLTKDFDEAMAAIEQFTKLRNKLLKKYPANTQCRTLNEMVSLEGKSSSNKKPAVKKQKEMDIIVSTNYIRIGNTIIEKNAADITRYHESNGGIIEIPNCYYEA